MKSGTLRWALVVAGLFFLLGLLRINDRSLYTDSTRYLIWGHSLSELRGFVDDTQPVPNRFVMNAPLYPILLVPVQWIFPLSVEAAKIWTLLWGSIALVFFFLWLRRYFSTAASVLLTFLLAVNPLFLTVSTEILSEAPFMAFVGVILFVADRFFANPSDKPSRITFLGCVAAIMLLREVGAAFVAASMIILFRQKRGKDLLLAGSLAGGLFLLWTLRNSVFVGSSDDGQSANVQYLFQHFVTTDQASIVSEFLTRAWLNSNGYALSIGGNFLYPFPESLIVAPSSLYDSLRTPIDAIRIPLFFLGAAAASFGIGRDLQSGPAGLFRLISLVAYILIILLYPVHDIRFFLPLLPLLLFYFACAWQGASERLNNLRAGKALGWLLLVLLLMPNVVAVGEILRTNHAYRSDPGSFSRTYESSPGQRHFDQPWSLIGDWIRTHCPDDAVIASPVKDIVPFVHPRLILETSRILPTPVFERYLRDFNAQYLITVNAWDSVETFQYQMPESRRLWFELLSGSAGIRVYKIHSSILEPPRGDEMRPMDTAVARGLLLEGRKAMLALRYQEALGYFGRCLEKDPTQPEIAFQIASALSFLGDSVGAMNMVGQLFTLPRATAYTQSVQSTLAIMEQTLKASRLSNASQRSFALFETGLAFWGLGYREAARSVMRTVVRLDSTNFVGALWGIHLARELGDTLESNRFLERLKRIDRTARIVGDWELIRRIGESIRKSREIGETTGLHLALARVYARIELFDEALDATLRALKLEPGNVDLWLYKGEVLEQKKALWGAAAAYREVLKLEPHNSFAKAKLDSLSM